MKNPAKVIKEAVKDARGFSDREEWEVLQLLTPAAPATSFPPTPP